MGRRWTRSQEDVGGLMEKSGGARRKHTQTPSTVSATCTVAATVQESLWNHKLWHSRHPLWHRWLSLVAAAELVTSRTFPQQMHLVVFRILQVLEPTVPIIILIPFPMGFQVKNTGIEILIMYIISHLLIALNWKILLTKENGTKFLSYCLWYWEVIFLSEFATVSLFPLLCSWVSVVYIILCL